MDGLSIWAGDGSTRVAAMKLMLYITSSGVNGEPVSKRRD